MTISQSLLPEFDQEMGNTRKILERVPGDKFGWKPHDKSMALGRLASHVAEMPGWAAYTINENGLDVTPDMKPFVAATTSELIEQFDKNVADARKAIAGATDEHLSKVWSLTSGGQTIFSMPRASVIRGMVMNHMIHHRAQLGVYLRLNNIAIPGMYGASADEH